MVQSVEHYLLRLNSIAISNLDNYHYIKDYIDHHCTAYQLVNILH
ncbi:hypothetical protein C3B55_00701 [Candidatus Pseudomonas adelgestsugas]|uniref:Integrase SAM-like N-terminal domain-containing protein n=1 Tax=Candidatus Pseudomonas adelgestsugas TaxID=1302376 RepID=A0ABX5R922_9PSED|nr:hypothetical protein C3B55_00701 [Candidatus Pseudomonas adelgestsugas]